MSRHQPVPTPAYDARMAPPPTIDTSLLESPGAAAVIVALSGGLDSTVLLDMLAARDDIRARGLRAVHVHHGLHADADAWAAHCMATCESLHVPLHIAHVQVRPSGAGPEAAARDARHEALRGACALGEVVAMAHHRDDQAETFLLRALRSSGPDGLAAMRPWRRFGDGWMWRPLLRLPRDALHAHAVRRGLRWIEDPSNGSDAFDRNHLRLHVMPLLRARWPHANAALASAADACAEAADLLADEDHRQLLAARMAADELDVRRLLAMDRPRRARVLRAWIASMGLPPLPREGIRRIEAELLPARRDAGSEFAWHGARIRRWRDRLHAARIVPGLDPAWTCTWTGEAPLSLPDGGVLELDPPLPKPVTVAPRRGGERIRLPGRAHHHRLKHVLQELGVPPWERDHLPLLTAADGELLAAGDLVASAGFQQFLDTAGARLRWTRPGAPRR